MPDAPASSADPDSAVRTVLATAVAALGGAERSGQVAMAEAVANAFTQHEHLLVQAGTGTGKSLAYLVPALVHDKRVVVATATLALQHQLVERDLPRLVEAVKGSPGVDTSYAVLKGRSNYACLHRIREGVPDDQGVLVDVPQGSMAEKVLELRQWAEQETKDKGTGERDSAPRHTDREWRQVSVGHRDCLGAQKCPFGEECFAEVARERAHRSHLVITNHSLLAIDAIEGIPMIPDYDAVVIDEAHELTARVTQAATDELTAADVERAARRSVRHVEGNEADDLADAGEALRDAMGEARPGRIERLDQELADALVLVRDAARACLSAYPKASDSKGGSGGEPDPGLTQAKGTVQDVFAVAERMAAGSSADVLWLNEGGTGGPGFSSRIPPRLCVAPLEVWGPMRDKLLSDKTVVMTSATLMLGGDFSSLATSVGLKPTERVAHDGRDLPDDALALGRARRRLAVRLQPAGHPLHRPAPAPAGSRRPGPGPARRDRRAGRRGRGPHPRAVLESARGRGRGRARPHPAAPPDHPRPGRGPAARARQAVRRGPPHLPLRHPQPLAGPRRPRRDLSAGAHRPHPLPPPRRPADERAAEGRRRCRRQRVHAGRGHPRGAAAGPGRWSAHPHHHRPRRRRRPRPPAGHRPLRQLPQGLAAARCGPRPTPRSCARRSRGSRRAEPPRT